MNTPLPDLARDVVRDALAAGADAADALAVESSEFRVTVRLGEIETFTDAGTRALGLRAFCGGRTAIAHTSDLTPRALAGLTRTVVEMARATSVDPAAGLPDATPVPDAVFRHATFLEGRLGAAVASPLVSVVDEGRRPRGLAARPFDGEGLATRTNVPVERGVLRHYLCDSYCARKIGAKATSSARRGVASGPTVGAGDLHLRAGDASPEEIIGEVARGLLVTDLIGFGVNLVMGDFSQGAAGQWIERGRIVHPVHEVTIAGNLSEMLRDIDAVGNDLVFRGSVSSPTLRIRKMIVSGE